MFKETFTMLYTLGAPNPRKEFLKSFRPESSSGIRVESWWRCEATAIPQSYRGSEPPIGSVRRER